LDWLNGKFPLTIETVKEMVVDRCDLPDGFNVDDYEFFQEIEVLHTPGHAGYAFSMR